MQSQPARHRYIKTLLYLIVLVLANAVSLKFFFHLDLTRSKRFSLSATSRKVVSTLSEPMTVKVFFTSRLPAPYNGVRRYLRDLLEEYSLYGNKYFSYQFHDVDPESGQLANKASANRSLALDYGIEPVQIQTIEKDEVKFQKAFMGLVLIHGDCIEKINALTSSEGLEYRLTTAMEKLNRKVSALLALDQPLQVNLYLSSNLEKVATVMKIGDLEQYAAKLRRAVDQLNQRAYGKLVFKRLDPSLNPEAAKQAKLYGLPGIKWPRIEKSGIEPGQATIGLVLKAGGNWRKIALLKAVRMPILGTRYSLVPAGKVKELIDLNLNVLLGINADLGYLVDHGTPRLGPVLPGRAEGKMEKFTSLVNQNYQIKPVRLQDGIPEGLKCLLIVSPQQKFTDWELYQIDQALMRGTNLAVFLDVLRPQRDQRGLAELGSLDTGLEKLLRHWGIEIEKSMVLDKKCYQQQRPRFMGGGQRPIYFAPILEQESIARQPQWMRAVNRLVVFQAAPVLPLNETLSQNGLKAHKLLASSDQSWTIGAKNLLEPDMLRVPPAAEMASRPLAYLVQGRFTSYFKGKPIPVQDPEKKAPGAAKAGENHDHKDVAVSEDNVEVTPEGITIEQSPPATIFVMGSGQMLSNVLLDSQGRSNNAIFVLNLIDALNDRPDRALMRGKQQTMNPLHPVPAEVKTMIKAFCIAGLPLLVIFSGLGVWLHRRRRQKKIRDNFGRRQKQ